MVLFTDSKIKCRRVNFLFFAVITTAPCPSDHAFAFFYGQLCCDVAIDGSDRPLTLASTTCRWNHQVDCPTSNCTDGGKKNQKVFCFALPCLTLPSLHFKLKQKLSFFWPNK